MIGKGFAEGIWFGVEYLVCAMDQPSIAEELVLESGIDVRVFWKILDATEYNTKILSEFLDGIQKRG